MFSPLAELIMAFEISLKGKTALVTGGARGIGAEICRRMALAGADIIVNYYHSDIDRNAAHLLVKQLEGMDVNTLRCEADVSSETEVVEMIERIRMQFGKLDIVVNNAGILTSRTFETMSLEEWRRLNSVILDGAFLVTKYALPLMGNGGSFVMITTNCTINGGGGSPAYPAAKSGVEGLARQIVVEYASKGIRANIIQPAVIDTDMFRQRYPTNDEVLAYGKKLPVGRVGTPADIANAAVFLSSDLAGYICGATLQVDGGRTFYSRIK
jgi:3-oxoacyl-[acyl-carrier protein] reductase